MAYKSLYRKYRPSNFEDVCGQQFIIKTLNNAIENNKVSHAYLFTGTRGTGKTTIAKIFAKRVNCLNMVNNKPCGKCEICLNENTDEIQDIIEIDAASNNGVDEIRELKNKIKLVPALCKYKVYIIDEVHMLSAGAFNALLKTLEEPPSHVIFILATTDPQKLPITIISRCQRFDFKRIEEEDIYKRLKYISECESIEIEDDALYEISRICDGAMRDAISILDQLSSYTSKKINIDDIYNLKGIVPAKTLVELVNSYIDQNQDKTLDIISNIYSYGKSFDLLLDSMLMLFRNVLINKKAPNYFKNKVFYLKDIVYDLSNKIDLNSAQNIIIKLENLSKEIKNSNYPRVLFEICLLSDYNDNSSKSSSNNKALDNYDKTNDNINFKTSNIKQKNVVKNDETNTLKREYECSVSSINNEEIINNSNDTLQKNKNRVSVNSQTSNKKALINNTIAEASTRYKSIVQEIYSNLDDYMIDSTYKNAASILRDSNVAAASNDHILLVYKYASRVIENDAEMELIREILSNELNHIVKIVAISEEEWKKIRPYYVDLKKKNGKIDLMDENIEEKKDNKINLNPIDDIVNVFGSEIVEMEG